MKRKQDLAVRSLRDEAIHFLEGLANLPDDEKAYTWFKTNFPHTFNSVSRYLVRYWATNAEGPDYEPGRPDEVLLREYWVLPLRNSLRNLWRTPDSRTKEWGMFRISQDFFLQGAGNVVETPISDSPGFLTGLKPPSRTEELLLQFVKMADLTRYCGNPDCDAPYFIAKKRSFKYCSDACSRIAQRQYKQKWWNEHGDAWREARKTKKTSKG